MERNSKTEYEQAAKEQAKRNGYQFRKFCKDSGYSAKTVAEMTGLSVNTIWQYWAGSRNPSRFAKQLISERLGCNAFEMFKY